MSCLTSPSLRIRQSTIDDRLHQRLVGDVDPQVHRVQRREAARRRTARAPRAAGRAGCWPGTATSAAARRLRELRLEVLEDVEVGLQRVADVDVALVAAGPEERLAARDVLDVVGDRRRGRAARRTRPRRSRRRPGRRRASRRGTRRRARSARRRRRAGGRACRSCVSTASKAMDPTTVSAHGGRGRVACRRHARDPDQRVGRPRGARARRGRPGARARRRRGARSASRARASTSPTPTRARTPTSRATSCRSTPGAEVAGVTAEGTGAARRRAVSAPAATPSTSPADEATDVPDPRRRERRHGAGAAPPGPDRLAPVPDLARGSRRGRDRGRARRGRRGRLARRPARHAAWAPAA